MLHKKLLLCSCLVSASMLVGSTSFAGTLKYYNTIQDYKAQTGKTITKFTQSPILNKSHLPDINKRLKGTEVLVEQPQDTIGTYGGQATVFTSKSYFTEDATGFVADEGLLKLGPDNNTIVPNIAKSYKIEKDNKTIHITLRKGLKWSDGYPFNTDDIKFLSEYIHNDKSITPGSLEYTLSFQSKYDFTIKFKDANSFGKEWLAHFNGSSFIKPAHYLKKFHIKFNKNANKDAIKAGYKSWKVLLTSKLSSNDLNVDENLPTLQDYYLKSKNSTTVMFARNPYYWKVDTKGQQLPYVDQMKVKIVSDPEIIAARVISGQADWAIFNNTINKIPIYKQSEKKGHIKTYIWEEAMSSVPTIEFNQTYTGKDKVGAEIIKQVDFRKAFSYALNRNQMNDVLYFGKGHPSQMTVHSSSKYYKKEYAQAFAQYSPKKANALLDKLGLKWDRHHKYRVRKDGKQLQFVLEYQNTQGSASKILEMVQSDVGKVGINLLLKENERSIQVARNVEGLNLISTWNGDSNTDILLWSMPKYYVPFHYHQGQNAWGGQWANWLVTKHKGEPIKGIEPPQDIKDLYATYLKLLSTSDEKEKLKLGDKILKYQATHLLTVGLVASPPFPLVTKDNLQNIPTHGLTGYDTHWGETYAPETRYFKKPLYPAQVIR